MGKVLISSSPVNSSPFPNKKSLPAIPLPTDAKVDGNPTLSNSSRLTSKNSKPFTHTPPEPEPLLNATTKPLKVKLTLLHTSTSQRTLSLNLRPPLPKPQFPSPLRLTRLFSNHTPAVLWTQPLAEPNSITPLPPSDTEPKVVKTTTL